MAKSTSTKLSIPHSVGDCSIVGILEQLAPDEPTQCRKIALILHGSNGHKDYLFQKGLAHRLPMDSFRFDFRGNHESGGTLRFGGFKDDVVDLCVVVDYLKSNFGYVIDMLVGHSRGSVVAMNWFCTSEDAKHASAFVNVSGRYRTFVDLFVGPSAQKALDEKGYYETRTTVARQLVVAKVYPEDLKEFSEFDTSLVWDRFPQHIDVLTLHGLADKVVPPLRSRFDGFIYARALGNRSPGTHNLHIVEEADHNFTGRQDEVVDTILEWWDLHHAKELNTGLWMSGVRGKL